MKKYKFFIELLNCCQTMNVKDLDFRYLIEIHLYEHKDFKPKIISLTQSFFFVKRNF